jgi:hypothetical protein
VLYTAILVPVRLSIWSSDNICHTYPLLKLDLFVDCWFMLEFLLRGFVGEYVDGKYVDDVWTLLHRRAADLPRTVIDLISAFPFTAVGYSLLAVRGVCDSSLRVENSVCAFNRPFSPHLSALFSLLRSSSSSYKHLSVSL